MEGGTSLVVRDQVIGVSIHSDGDRPELRFLRLQRKKNEIQILGQGIAVDAVDLKRRCGTRAPVVIVVNTPRCLHRVLPESAPLDLMVQKAFPGASLEQLHVTAWTEGTTTGLSMMRRESCVAICSSLRSCGSRIVRVSIGPWILLHLRPLLPESSGNDPEVAGNVFAIQDGKLLAPPTTLDDTGTFKIGMDEIPNSHALAIAAAWEYLVPAVQLQYLNTAEEEQDRLEEKARIRYEWGLVGLAAILLLMLIMDQGIKTWINDQQEESTFSLNDQTLLRGQVEELKEQLAAREAMAMEFGLVGSEPFALRASRLLDQVPKEIQLDRMMLNPLTSQLKDNERPSVEIRHIRLKGSCTDGNVLNAWMNTLRKVEGVVDVRLIAFSTDIPGKRPVFEIDLEG